MIIRMGQQNFIDISTLYQVICDFLDVHERSELQDTTLTLHTLPHVSRNLSIDAQGILQVNPEDLIEFPIWRQRKKMKTWYLSSRAEIGTSSS